MARILIVPDKFKGSMTASEAVDRILSAFRDFSGEHTAVTVPLADGGEGSLLSMFASTGGQWISCMSVDALGRPLVAEYLRKGSTAFIESSRSCGLQLLPQGLRQPMTTNTFGVGMMVRHAVLNGCSDIHLFLGGSATHDAGTGMAMALGYRFYNIQGEEIYPCGENLRYIHQLGRVPNAVPLNACTFSAWADVQVPFTGEEGSIRFAAQKGADSAALEILKEGTDCFSRVLSRTFPDIYDADACCMGAGGGLGAACCVFLGASLGLGWKILSDFHNLANKISESDYVITGEGCLDGQTVNGKLVFGITSLCKAKQKPCIIFCGHALLTEEERRAMGHPLIIPLSDSGNDLDESIQNGAQRLEEKARVWFASLTG